MIFKCEVVWMTFIKSFSKYEDGCSLFENRRDHYNMVDDLHWLIIDNCFPLFSRAMEESNSFFENTSWKVNHHLFIYRHSLTFFHSFLRHLFYFYVISWSLNLIPSFGLSTSLFRFLCCYNALYVFIILSFSSYLFFSLLFVLFHGYSFSKLIRIALEVF